MFAVSKRMKHLFTIFILILCISSVNALEHPPGYVDLIDLPVTVRVDTTNADIKAVYDLVRKFLSTRPDSLFDNPCWDEDEKKKFPEPYPAREIIYKDAQIIKSFPPRVLSIDKEGDYYCTRIMYYREGLEQPYQSSNPWAIQRLYAKKVKIKKKKDESDSSNVEESETITLGPDGTEEKKKKKDNKEYRLFNPLHVLTKDWRHDRIGPIDYYYPQDYYLNRKTAQSMVLFCKNLRGKYNLEDVEPISFYITRNENELAEILGLDFILAPPPGMSHAKNAQIFSALGDEYYSHEIVHVYFRDYRPHFVLTEGMATYAGGSMKKSFKDLVDELAVYLEQNDTITFQNFLDTPVLKGSNTLYYTVGAVLCRMAKQAGGNKAVVELMKSGQSTEQLYQQIELVLGVKPDGITQAIRDKVKEYAGTTVAE